jgi:hypothetical protein
MTPWLHLPFEAESICMSFGSGVHDASWLYVCARDTLIVRVFDLEERPYKESDSFELARQGAAFCYSFAARKPWMAVEFIHWGDHHMYEQGVLAPLWAVCRGRLACPRFTRDGLHVAIVVNVQEDVCRGSLELLRLHDGVSRGFAFRDVETLLEPFQLEDESWLSVRRHSRLTMFHDDAPVWSTIQGIIHDVCLVPGLGVIARCLSKILVLTTPDQAKMDTMTALRVAWMTAAKRSQELPLM